MDLQIFKDPETLATKASTWCQEKKLKTNARSVYLPAGTTPINLYQHWTKTDPGFLKGLQLIQIDDVLTGPKAGQFKKFFGDHLGKFTSQMSWINERYEQGDLAILGLGLNGHIAFHEPELPKNFYAGCVRLSDKTCQNLGLSEITWGITYGASAFLKSKSILMIVTGATKKEVLKRLLAKDPSLPASQLCAHHDFTIMADAQAVPAGSAGW